MTNTVKTNPEKVTLLNHRGEPLKEITLRTKDEIMQVNQKEYGIGETETKSDIADKSESVQESPELSLQKAILAKPHMTAHHKKRLQKRTDELVNNNDKAGLEQLNKGIDFTVHGGLICNTPQGQLKFKPKQATFDDVKNIDGLKEDKNIWTENKETRKKGLRANFEASKKMRDAGKKICADEQYLAAANVFPGGDTLDKNNRSTKVKDFFDLMGADQYGFRNPDGDWVSSSRYLRSASASGGGAYSMTCHDAGGRSLNRNYKDYGFGVWFLED